VKDSETPLCDILFPSQSLTKITSTKMEGCEVTSYKNFSEWAVSTQSLCTSRGDKTKMDLRFKHPANSLVCGGSGAGKSFFMKRLVENRKEMFDVIFEEIVWHYTEWQEIYNDLQSCQGVIC